MTKLLIIVGALLFVGSGSLTSLALSAGTSANTKTITISVTNGPPGPPGPKGEKGDTGPRGPAGLECPANFSPGTLVINHPGGQTITWTCLHD